MFTKWRQVSINKREVIENEMAKYMDTQKDRKKRGEIERAKGKIQRDGREKMKRKEKK